MVHLPNCGRAGLVTAITGPELPLVSGAGVALIAVIVGATAGLIVRSGRQPSGRDPDEPAADSADDG